jgi:hypothetical protein
LRLQLLLLAAPGWLFVLMMTALPLPPAPQLLPAGTVGGGMGDILRIMDILIQEKEGQRDSREKPSENRLDESEWQIMKIEVQSFYMYSY